MTSHLVDAEQESILLLNGRESLSSYASLDSSSENNKQDATKETRTPLHFGAWSQSFWNFSQSQLPKLSETTLEQRRKKRLDEEMAQFLKPSKSSGINIVGWLLFVFLLLTIGWVVIFTVSESHIDWADMLHYQAIHSSKSLQKKEGFRTLTYMGISYLLPGFVSLLCLFVGFHLPYSLTSANMSRLIRVPSPWKSRTVWSLWDLLIILLFVLVLIGSFVIRLWHKYSPDWTTYDLWHYLTKISGMTLVNILLVILLPICKTCFWWDLFGVGFDRVLKFHRLMGRCFGVGIFLHGVVSVIYLTMGQQFRSCLWIGSQSCDKPMITYGWISGILFLPVFITTIPWIRRNKFEWFYYMHFCVLPALIFAHLHHPSLIYYVSPGLTAYILDKMIGFASSWRPIRVVDLTVPVPGYTRLTLAVSKRSSQFEPGQWIKVKIPAISKWEWHPFSITSAPRNSTIILDIKRMGNNSWSTKLEQLAISRDRDGTGLPAVYLDRYQGSKHTSGNGYLNHSAVFMVAGGIGVTPMISALRTLAQGDLPKKIRLVKFVWVVKQECVVDLYRDELAQYQALARKQGSNLRHKIDIAVYVTQSERELTNPEEPPPRVRCKSLFFFPSMPCNKRLRPVAFSKTVRGHAHHLLLMVAASVGFLRGILLGSSIAEEKKWTQETAVLLQLLFGAIFASILSAIVLAASFLGSPPRWASKIKSIDDESYCQDPDTLNVYRGHRPDIGALVSEMKASCIRRGISTAGVSVCGPVPLTKAVMHATYSASSPDGVQFILGEESFEW
jgi:predicted ferric reductase